MVLTSRSLGPAMLRTALPRVFQIAARAPASKHAVRVMSQHPPRALHGPVEEISYFDQAGLGAPCTGGESYPGACVSFQYE